MKTFYPLFAFLFFAVSMNAQPDFPKRGHVFNNDLVPKVHITMNEDSLEWLYDHTGSDHEFKADFVFESGESFDTVTNVGIRLRGNTSRDSQKKSFKISFNSFVKGQKYKDLEKMNLNGEHNDPSVIRSYLFWNICRDMQVQGSRANHVELYINNRYYGLYMNVEHIDEEFIQKRFNHNQGNLYKCLWGADFTYQGDNAQTYKDLSYTLENNEETSDYSKLIALIKTLNQTSNEQLPAKIEPLFNVNSYLRYLALEAFTANWDGYSFNKNNYYLYENVYTGKTEFMPYDVDNTFGIDWFGIDWAQRDIYNWASDGGNRPLTTKLLANQVYKDRYSFFLNELIANIVNPDTLFPKIDRIKAMIDQSAENDTYRPLDYGWSYADYSRSYTEALGAHVKYGLKPYIEARIASIKTQIQLNSIAPIVENIYHNFPTINQAIQVTCNVTDDQANATAKLFYSFNGSADQQVSFVLNNDNWLATVPATNAKGTFKYYVLATDASGNNTRDPLTGYYEMNIGASDVKLAINEFMADNTVSVLDNYGQYEDWIEIVNTGTSPINLKGKYLTDDFTDKAKWALPDTTILAGGFYMVWADDDGKQGKNHANFKLSKKGDQLGLFDGISNNYAAIDTVVFGAQTSDISYGKIDGTWSEQTRINPGGPNEDANYAYVTFSYNMNQQIALQRFDQTTEYIDVAGNFNNWFGGEMLVDNDGDGIIRGTLFGFTKAQQIEYKARMNGDWSRGEFPTLGSDGNRKAKLVAGKNYFIHWFNDEELDVQEPIAENGQLLVYPNPSSTGMITITHQNTNGSLMLYSLSGQLVRDFQVSGNKQQIATDGLTKGIYLLMFKGEDHTTQATKLVIQ